MKRSPETSLAQINIAINMLRPKIEEIAEYVAPDALHELILKILQQPLNLFDLYEDKLQAIELNIRQDEQKLLDEYNEFKNMLYQNIISWGYQLDTVNLLDEFRDLLHQLIITGDQQDIDIFDLLDVINAYKIKRKLEPKQDLAADFSLGAEGSDRSIITLYATIFTYWLWYEIVRGCQKREVTVAEKHNDLGYEYAQKGDYHNALVEYKKATNCSPGFHLAWVNTGIALKNLGDIDEAIKCFDYVIEHIDKNYKKAWHNKAVALQHKGDIEGALECCNKALEIHPFYEAAVQLRDELGDQLDAPLPSELFGAAPWRRAEAHITKGVYALQAGNLKQASAHFKCAIKLRYEEDSNPFNLMACKHLVGLAHYNLGLTYATEGQGYESRQKMIKAYESAIVELEKAISVGEHVSEFQSFVADAHHYIDRINALIADD